MKDIYELLSQFATIEKDIPLAKMTTLRIGGVARYVAFPNTTLGLDSLVRALHRENVPYKLIGKGSNLLCGDDVFEGVIIRLDKLDEYYFDGNIVTAQAGCSIIALAYEAMKQSLSGLEFASGIPGTVGGCTYMNAGAYKKSMSDIITEVLVYRDGEFDWVQNKDCGFSYRTSMFQSHPDWIVIAVRLKLENEAQEEIRSLMDSRRERRMASQPLDKPSAGSVFRNPDQVPAWQLIEGIGYRGHQIGGAKVSDKHVNFIINNGGATAKDYISLIQEIQQKVLEKYGIELHTEVEKFNW